MIAVTPETEELVRRLAEQRGKTPEQVLKEAVEMQARLVGVPLDETVRPPRPIDMERVRRITRRVVSRPLLDRRTPKDILDEVWGVSG